VMPARGNLYDQRLYKVVDWLSPICDARRGAPAPSTRARRGHAA